MAAWVQTKQKYNSFDFQYDVVLEKTWEFNESSCVAFLP